VVELVALRASAERTVHHTFRLTSRALMRDREPGLVRVLAVIDGDSPIVIREALDESTLADILKPLPAEVIAAIASRLIPAVLVAGSATQGALSAEDIRLDPSGRPVLTPRVSAPSRVGRALARHAAPESFSGSPPDGAAGLYGLGAVLYRLATGRDAFRGSKPGPRSAPPAPSTVYPGLPLWLDAAILTLLSSDPSERSRALPAFLEHAAEVGDLRDHVQSPVGKVKLSQRTETQRRGHFDRPPTAAVVVDSRDLSALDPESRSLLAGYAQLPITVLDELAESGLPVVVQHFGNRHNAGQHARELRALTGLPVLASASNAWRPWMLASVCGIAAVPPLAIGAGLLFTGFGAIAAVPLVVGGVAATLGLVATGRAAAQSRQYKRAEKSTVAVKDAMRHRGGTRLAATWSRLAGLRQQLGQMDLPATASADLRSTMKDIERRLEQIASVIGTADQTLQGADLDARRTQLGALEGTRTPRPERDRLARTVADLEDVARRRERLTAERTRIDAALDEFSGVLAQVAASDSELGDADEKLTTLLETARLVRSARAETE
jgi:hypothetical protein